MDETTRLDPGASGAVTRAASDSGWLSSSGVALKFLPVVLSTDPGRLAQFHNEVRTARQVSHPNACRVYDIGEIEGQLFITMEYVGGEDLAALLRRIGRLPEDKGIEIARQICAGLAAAHERGVLHRDLKPANVMLDGAGRVRLMDFSLASAGAVTDIGAGTPAYMAPEQLAGQEVTVRSDIYALGLVLYEINLGASGIPLERYLPAISASLDTLIELIVLLRIGLFATVVMFFTSSMLDRMPMAFASSSLLASSTWATLTLLLGIAVLGFRLAARPGRSRMAIG